MGRHGAEWDAALCLCFTGPQGRSEGPGGHACALLEDPVQWLWSALVGEAGVQSEVGEGAPGIGQARADVADSPGGGQAAGLSTEGTRDCWETRWEIRTATSLSDLQEALTKHLTEMGQWTPRDASAGTSREWRFKDAEKRGWRALVDLQPTAGKTGEYQMAIRLEPAGA